MFIAVETNSNKYTELKLYLSSHVYLTDIFVVDNNKLGFNVIKGDYKPIINA